MSEKSEEKTMEPEEVAFALLRAHMAAEFVPHYLEKECAPEFAAVMALRAVDALLKEVGL